MGYPGRQRIVFNHPKKQVMKTGQTQTKNPATRYGTKPRPENKDNLDSREGEEQRFKGDDITHNKKAVKNKNKNRDK
jgi:hypothetical protein